MFCLSFVKVLNDLWKSCLETSGQIHDEAATRRKQCAAKAAKEDSAGLCIASPEPETEAEGADTGGGEGAAGHTAGEDAEPLFDTLLTEDQETRLHQMTSFCV